MEARRLAQSVRLFAALEEGDPEEVYKIASDELRLGEFAFFRLLDAEGKLIPPGADSRAGVFDAAGLQGEWLPHGKAVSSTTSIDRKRESRMKQANGRAQRLATITMMGLALATGVSVGVAEAFLDEPAQAKLRRMGKLDRPACKLAGDGRGGAALMSRCDDHQCLSETEFLDLRKR